MIEQEFLIRKKERIGFLMISILVLAPIFTFMLFLWWAINSPLILDETKKLKISKGDGFLEIGEKLESEGIVRSAILFRLYVLLRGWAGNLQPGEYIFEKKLSIPEVSRKLVLGPGDIEITFPEGLTMYEIEERLVKEELVSPGEFVTLSHSPDLFEEKFPFLSEIEADSLEGFLFPDTYRFNSRLGSRGIIEKMLTAFQNKVLKELDSQFRASPQSIFNIITMASMIERESHSPEDRRLISGILWKRLENNIPLQVDATVIYAWKKLNPKWSLGSKKRLSFSDLKIDSPYNTYKITGMPPGPISNPGLDSIRAALEPQESEYWYYLSVDDGTTYFSKTFEQHTRLKQELYY